MALHSANLQKAIFTALNGDSTLGNLVTGVYDCIPDNTAFPYVVIGEETGRNNGTVTLDGLEYTLTMHVWSDYKGSYETKNIMARIYDLLHNQSIAVTGASLVNIRQEFEQIVIDSDGVTRHGIIRFRAVVFDSD